MTRKELVDKLVKLAHEEYLDMCDSWDKADQSLRRKFNRILKQYDEDQRKYYEQDY